MGGDDLYEYVAGSPVGLTDPTGLVVVSIEAGPPQVTPNVVVDSGTIQPHKCFFTSKSGSGWRNCPGFKWKKVRTVILHTFNQYENGQPWLALSFRALAPRSAPRARSSEVQA